MRDNITIVALLVCEVLLQSSGADLTAAPDVVHVEGTTICRTFDIHGEVLKEQKPKKFNLSLSGNQWAVRLYADTNQPGGVTDVSCDGTNIYVYVPNSGETLPPKFANLAFSDTGSVYPGVVKPFPFQMGAIWWAYCSAEVTGGTNGHVLDFMSLLGEGLKNPETLRVEYAEKMNGGRRIGTTGSWLYPSKREALQNKAGGLLAHCEPLEVVTLGGAVAVKRFCVTVYNRPASDGTDPTKEYEYLITATGISFGGEPVAAVPQISHLALIADHREPNSGEYVANQWLDSRERKISRLWPVAP